MSGNTREGKDLQNQPQSVKKMATGTYISIITLNVNGLNAPTKRHRLAEWIQKRRPIYMLSIRNTNTWRLNSTFLNNQQVTEEIKKGNQKISRQKRQ